MRLFARYGLHAAGGLGETSHLAGALAGAGGEQFVDFLQLEAGVLGHDAHHGGDAVLLVVILQEVNDLHVVIGEGGDTFGFLHEFEPFGAPVFKAEQEAVFVDFESLTLERNFSHGSPPWTCWDCGELPEQTLWLTY